MTKSLQYKMTRAVCAFVAIAILFSGIVFTSKRSEAQVRCCLCVVAVTVKEATEWWGPLGTYFSIRRHLNRQFRRHRNWFTDWLWDKQILRAMMMMTEQLNAVSMLQTAMVGTFYDAEHQMQRQESIQKITARAHKDYHTSEGMCDFGTFTRTLAQSERKGELSTYTYSQRSQDRLLNHHNAPTQQGERFDIESRLRQYRTTFCDPHDHNDGLRFICQHQPEDKVVTDQEGIGGTDPERLNKDIDYSRTFSWPWTLDIDFSNIGDPTEHEEEIIALSANLYGHEAFDNMPAADLQTYAGQDISIRQQAYQDLRAFKAKLSVAQNSFNAVMSMKSAGEESSKDYLIAVLTELDVPQAEAERMVAGESNPSYWAQMEILTKKAYQNPNFYTNLYDTPANVKRKGAAIQAIALMQKFDLLKSHLRTENILAIMLELEADKLQDEIEGEINERAGNSGGTAGKT